MSGPCARKIMLIRHAEKPDESGAPPGYMWDGTPCERSLTTRGWQRAHGLSQLFTRKRVRNGKTDLATPDFLFASGVGPGSKSWRPQQTIGPLSYKLGVPINSDYLKGFPGVKHMVKHATMCPGNVLISWVHDELPEIANRILGDDDTAPQHWPGRRYDLVWVFERASDSTIYRFSQVPQLLLNGDIDEVVE